MTAPRFRIHPAIGIARVGNAEASRDRSSSDGFFIGPETPGVPANWDFDARRFSSFKDAAGRVKRQAARFRIWEYEERDGKMTPLREVTLDDTDVESITWKVTVANTKASFYTFRQEKGSADTFDGNHPRRNEEVTDRRRLRLEIRPPAREIAGRFAEPVDLDDDETMVPIKTLGQLRTDELGRLVFLGGTGKAAAPQNGRMPDAYNNSGWFDDVSDGPVSATIKLRGSPEFIAQGAWVIVGPPDFAPAIGSVVTLYDLLVDITVTTLDIPPGDGLYTEYARGHGLHRLVGLKEAWARSAGTLSGYRPSYVNDILPTLLRAASMRWVHDSGYSFHEWMAADHMKSFGDPDTGADVRQAIFSWFRDPNKKQVRPWLMPRTFADDYDVPDKASRYLSLTRTQHALMGRWAEGKFEPDYPGPEKPTEPDISPEGLDRAALENCSGGGFCPGMEVGWLIRKPEVYSEPFRIKPGARVDSLTVGPGFFSQQIALPWHADFWECQKEADDQAAGVYQAWWPASRPDDVRKAGSDAILEWNRDIETKEKMAEKWSSRGFVLWTDEGFFEEEGPA